MPSVPNMSVLCLQQETNSLENWAVPFKIPYDKMPNDVIKKCRSSQRPDPGERAHFIRTLCYEIAKFSTRPGTKNLEIIASKIINDFPSSFQDEISGNRIGSGYESLLKSMIVRFDNMNRVKGDSLKRQVTHQVCRKKKVNNNIQPDAFPENETKESQDEKKVWLQKEFQKKNYDSKSVQNIMSLTFASQRLLINSGLSIEAIVQEWPFLKEEKYLLNHFDLLISPNIVDWDVVLNMKIPEVRSFLKTKKNSTEENAVKEVLCLLLQYFNEQNEIYKVYEEYLSADDIEKDETFPITPVIVFFGQTNKAMLFIEQKRVSGYIDDTIEAFKMWFASFYVFNIQYAAGSICTMGFIQRALVGMKNEKRLKCANKILKLVQELCNYKSLWKV